MSWTDEQLTDMFGDDSIGKLADDILSETQEILDHRARVTGIQEMCDVLIESVIHGKDE